MNSIVDHNGEISPRKNSSVMFTLIAICGKMVWRLSFQMAIVDGIECMEVIND